ncbi:MAG: hypothetical protein ACHQ6T_07375 [Myxococcota bacterium]
MARRPEGVDPAVWKEQRAAYWKRINRTLNVTMVIAIALLIARYFGWLPVGR